MTQLRVAVIGAGPAGIYAADILAKESRGRGVSIDLFDRLPVPYGLVRYGVAPDHPRIKGVVSALREVLDRGELRFFGNVDFGTDIDLDDLRRHYHAVIFSTGAIRDAELAVPGIEAHGSYGAADFVSWYDGHPDVPRSWPLDAESVAVVGNGNVALDVARMLAKGADDLLVTEIPANVYEDLKSSAVRDVHVFGRRSPLQAKFSPLELRELGEVNDLDIIVDDEDFEQDDYSQKLVASNKQVFVLNKIFSSWRQRTVGTATRRLHFHFYAKPVQILAGPNGAVSEIQYARMAPDGEGGVHETGELRTLPVGAVYRAVGYFGTPLSGLPFDASRGVIPNSAGRVGESTEAGEAIPGLYVTGWIKRGPVGLIGSTKSDALETINGLLEDMYELPAPPHPDEDDVDRMLQEKGIDYTTLYGWEKLDMHEQALGEEAGRERIKVVPRDEMVQISRLGSVVAR